MWPFRRNKYKKLNREDLVNSICELERQERTVEAEVFQKIKEIDALMDKGKKEKNRDLQLFYAKKISHLNEEKQVCMERGMYLLYNIRLMTKLKDAYDSNTFFKTQTKVPLSDLLRDQKGLAKFLNKALETRIASEDVLTSADEVFAEVQAAYDVSQPIYGVGKSEEDILTMFEKENQLADENELAVEVQASEPVKKKKAKLGE
ncbi:MAG: hypothetical protein IJX00_01330 [Clostridia bacterium]|jgi:hypothetical protein|nr:hypothetical protein [Clostridia bacterium]